MVACSLPDMKDPTVDTFEGFASRAAFSCPLPSMVYTLHYFGKSIAVRGMAELTAA
jgi:hypothetical protein